MYNNVHVTIYLLLEVLMAPVERCNSKIRSISPVMQLTHSSIQLTISKRQKKHTKVHSFFDTLIPDFNGAREIFLAHAGPTARDNTVSMRYDLLHNIMNISDIHSILSKLYDSTCSSLLISWNQQSPKIRFEAA